MSRLEDLRPNVSIRGILPDEQVTVSRFSGLDRKQSS
jgi:hypothetical protein